MESCTIASYSSEDVNKYIAPPPTQKKGKKRNHQFPTGTQVGTPVNKETDTENKIQKTCNLTTLPTLPWGQLPTFRFISIPWRSRSSAPDPAHLRLLHSGQGPVVSRATRLSGLNSVVGSKMARFAYPKTGASLIAVALSVPNSMFWINPSGFF